MKRGVTLVETIMVILIFGIVSVALSMWVVNFYQTYYFTFNQTKTVMEAERAIKIMIREIREATTAQDGAYILATTTDTVFSFYCDVDRDEEIELISYYAEDHKFIRSVVEPTNNFPPEYTNTPTTRVISIDVVNAPSIFKYYDSDGNELETTPVRRKDTKLMEVMILINTSPDRLNNYQLKSSVQIRNLKDNI